MPTDQEIITANRSQPLSWWHDSVSATSTRTTKGDVMRVLAQRGKLDEVLIADRVVGTNGNTKAFWAIISQFDEVDLTRPAIQTYLTGMVTDGVLVAADRTALLALSTVTVPRWQSLGVSRAVTQSDIDLSPAP